MLRAFIAGVACAAAVFSARDRRRGARESRGARADDARGAAPAASTTRTGQALYDSAKAVDEYVTFHYSARSTIAGALRTFPYEDMVREGVDVRSALGFVEACARVVVEAMEARLASSAAAGTMTSALDVGCAVGGTSAALAKHGRFTRVVGVDYSRAFVDAAKRAQSGAFDARDGYEADADALSRCVFERGDACALREDIGTFDAVVAANLLCRLPDPEAFLRACVNITNVGGALVLASPYSWLEEWTPRDRWLDFPAVRAILEPAFVLERECDLPFIIREHARKFQLGVSHVAVFRRV